MALLLVFDPASLDFRIEKMFYSPDTGFVGQRFSWFENILHDRAKQGVIAVGVFAIAGFLLSLFPTRLAVWLRQLGYVVLAIGHLRHDVSRDVCETSQVAYSAAD